MRQQTTDGTLKDKTDGEDDVDGDEDAVSTSMEDARAEELAAGCLTDSELSLKARLESDGFGEWNRRHLTQFIRACERYGRSNIKEIAHSGMIDDHSPQYITEYANTFWKRYKSIAGWDKLLKAIERGEARREKEIAIQTTIDNKVKRHRNAWETLSFSYPSAQKLWNAEEDRFLLCVLSKVGWGEWDQVKSEVRQSWRFRFDWYFKSRNVTEIARRADYLVKLCEKEEEIIAEKNREKAARARKSTKASASKGAKRASSSKGRPSSASKKAKR